MNTAVRSAFSLAPQIMLIAEKRLLFGAITATQEAWQSLLKEQPLRQRRRSKN
jgi:hypothetical protein